jgi:arylsulfatase A-like enzyme
VARPVRYTFILALTALAVALAAFGGWQFARASAPVNGPIILISVDSLRADHLPAYGYAQGDTPTIDALAADGIVFERAYAHTPQTLPSHATLLTGRLPFETGVRDDVGFTLAAGERLLPELLHERGFATGGVVSTYLLRPSTGLARGFDFYDAEMPADQLGRPIDRIERDGAASEAIAEHWLGSQDSSRVFLFLQIDEPHAPYQPPERFASLQPYDGEVAYADEIIGRLVRWLKGHQLYDRSTILLVGDHGEGLDNHGEGEHGLLLYEEDIHVPFILKPAGGVGAGQRVAGVVELADVTPTILDLAKAPLPGSLRGSSLEPVIDGGTVPDRVVYAESGFGRTFFGWSAISSLIDGRYQYIRAPREELFDLRADPREMRNLAPAAEAVRATELAPDADLARRRRELDALTEHAPALRARPAADENDPLFAGSYGRTRLPAPPDADPADIDPKDAVPTLERYRASMDHAARREWAPALDGLEKLLRASPDQPNVWRDLASVALGAGQLDRAVAALDRVAALAPSDADAPLESAALLLSTRRLDAARAQALSALERAGNDRGRQWRAHALLAGVALARQDRDVATREAALADDADPGTPIADLVEARLLVAEGRDEDAGAALRQALDGLDSRDARLPGLHELAAETLIRLGRPLEAEAQLSDELKAFPESPGARKALADLGASGRLDLAGRTSAARR